MFIKQNKEGKIIIVSIYVDDLLFTRNYENMMLDFKNSMKKEFDMTDLGKMSFFPWNRGKAKNKWNLYVKRSILLRF